MSPRRLLKLLAPGAALVAACALAAPTHAAAVPTGAAPSLSVHAIFSGGQTSNIRAGQVLIAIVRHSGGQDVRSICWEPAPIGRPACGTAQTGAPAQAGTQRVVVTLSDASTLTKTITVLPPATRFNGRYMAPSHIACADAGLYGNYDRRHHRSVGLLERMPRGTRVGVLNRIAPGKIFMWDYATAKAGFASERCAQPGLS
jgi:hypothetical protein